MSESIKIGIFVSAGLLLAIIVSWDLLFGDRYGSTTFTHTSNTGLNYAQNSHETSPANDETLDETELDSTQTKTESAHSTSYSYAAPNYKQTANTSAEPIAPSSQPSGSPQSQNTDNARSTDSTQAPMVSSRTVTAESTPRENVESDTQDASVSVEHIQEDPDIQIARNSVQRLEQALNRKQTSSDQQPEAAASRTNKQATGKTSTSKLTKVANVANAKATTLEPNTDRALSISYQFDTEVMCAPPPDQTTKIDVLYRKNSYSIKGLSLYDIDRLVQLYRVCGGTLSITKNELPYTEPDAELYTRRQNEVKYLLTQLRVKKGDMVFSDSKTTDQ